MGLLKKIAIPLALLATLLWVLSFCTPWFFTKWGGRHDERTNCFIDGTCRNNDYIWKNNGEAQRIYDATMILMIISIVPFLIFVHYLLFIRSRRYHHLPGRRIIAFLSGLLAFLLILAAVIVFGAGIDNKYNLNGGLFGSRRTDRVLIDSDVDNNDGTVRKYRWGANAGWFFAIFSLLPLLIATILSLLLKPKTEKNTAVVKEKTTVTNTTTVPSKY